MLKEARKIFLFQLTALQEAHEREIATYLSNIAPLREQLEVQQVSITTLQTQLSATKEELAVVTVERDHLNNRLNSLESLRSFDVGGNGNCEGGDQVEQLHKKVGFLFLVVILFLLNCLMFIKTQMFRKN